VNKTEFKSTMLKAEVQMMGDRWHNEMIEQFLDGVKQSTLSRKVQDYIADQFKKSTQRWITLVFTKGEMRVLNSMCKAKSAKTLEKRQLMFIRDLTKSYSGMIFNSGKVDDFMKLFEMEV